jgi:alpha-D-xyloside xylohydrolase
MRDWVVGAILVAAGCGDDGVPSSSATTGTTTAPPTGTVTGTGTDDGTSTSTGDDVPPVFWVRWEADALTLSLMRDDTPLLQFPADGFQWAVVDAIDDALSYDPMFPIDAQWRSVIAGEEVDGGTLSVRLTFEGQGHARIRIDETAPGRFAATWQPEADAPTIAAYRFRPRTDPAEGYYGLGEYFDTPNHRGRDRALQLEVDLGIESSYNEAHVPIPLLIGTTGWGLFVDDLHAARFEVATQADDLVQATFGTGPDSADGVAFHLFGSEEALDVTTHYHAVTGAPARPAPWALGPWIWRNENADQAQVESDAAMLRDLDLATSALWIDRPYATGVNTFDFDPTRFPDPQAMIDLLHDHGLRVALWHTPYVSNMQEPATELYDEATAAGYFPPESGPFFNSWGLPIDLTHPDAYDWWQALIGQYDGMGIEGYKLDYAEDIVVGAATQRLPWLFDDGSTERTMHHAYQLFYHRVYAETLPGSGGFLLCRSGTIGDQVNASVIWPGDLDADLSEHRQDVADYTAVGGLPAAVVAGLSLGPSGFPLFASDTGGYRHSPPNKETMARWLQHTALSPVMQIGTASSDVIWEFNAENGFDDELLGWYRALTRLHLRLFPYLWTYVDRLAAPGEGGRPIMRAVGLAHPELGLHPRFDYLLGDHLLVAPVVHAGETEREVVFPPGRWLDWFDGTPYDGGTAITVPAPLSKLPLFLRAGAIVPLLRPTIDTLSPTAMPGQIDSYATTPGILFPRVMPGPATRFELFDGTLVEQAEDGGTVTLHWRGGDDFTEGAVFEVVGVAAPGDVLLDGAPLSSVGPGMVADVAQGWAHTDALGGTLFIRVPAGDHTVTITP